MYALNLAVDGRTLSATNPKYAPADAPTCDHLPDGDLYDYIFEEGEFVYDPVPGDKPDAPDVPEEEASVWDELDAAYQEGVDSV
jgi:hypothetical protein